MPQGNEVEVLQVQLEEVKKAFQKLELENLRQSKEILIIQRIAKEVNSILNLDQILQVILDTMDHMLMFKHSISICLLQRTLPTTFDPPNWRAR